jgi:hypothetical protein
LILDLFKYLAFLRPHLRVTIDFSLLQAVISWIQEALRSAPVHLPRITRSEALLSRAVSPTSGLGLTDIWSSWRGSVKSKSHPSEPEQVISGVDDNDVYRGSHIYWTSETRPHLLEHLVIGRCARVTPEDVLISQTSASRNEMLRLNKTSVIKELAILAHMHDGDTLPVCSSMHLVHATFTLNEI